MPRRKLWTLRNSFLGREHEISVPNLAAGDILDHSQVKVKFLFLFLYFYFLSITHIYILIQCFRLDFEPVKLVTWILLSETNKQRRMLQEISKQSKLPR